MSEAGPSNMVPGKFIALAPKFQHNKKAGEAILVSNFLVTFNTNIRFNDEDEILEELSRPLYRMCEVLFGDSDGLRRFVQFGRRGDRGADGKFEFILEDTIYWNTQNVVDFRVTASVEVGHNARGKRLHCHLAIKIRHRSHIRLDREKILRMANQYLEEVNYPYPIKHMNIRVLPLSAEDYLDK